MRVRSALTRHACFVLLLAAGLKLIVLHSVEGHEIWVAPWQITSLRQKSEPSHGLIVDGVNCLITLSDGKFITVIESCDDVRRLMERP